MRNPFEKGDPQGVLQRQSLGIVRERLLSDGFGERIRVHNYTTHPERCRLTLSWTRTSRTSSRCAACSRERRGERLPDECTDDRVVFSYMGTDGRSRHSELLFSERGRAIPGGLPIEIVEALPFGEEDIDPEALPADAPAPWSGSRIPGRGPDRLRLGTRARRAAIP